MKEFIEMVAACVVALAMYKVAPYVLEFVRSLIIVVFKKRKKNWTDDIHG